MPSPDESQPALKSIHHEWPAYLTFINRTNFVVDIIWISYQGNPIRYRKRLEPGACHHQNTFVTHPWQAWNSDTLDRVKVGGDYTFQPQPWRGEQERTVVFIDRPMHPLLMLCVEKLHSLVDPEHVEELEIPKDLFELLKRRREVTVRDYRPR